MQINTYLNFNGNCQEAFAYYEKVLGGKITDKMNYAGTPAAAHATPEWQDKILHTRLVVGDQVLMGSDAPPGYYLPPQGFSVSIVLDDIVEGERIFTALAEGGKVTMPWAETFWAKRFGMLVDRFGTPWLVNCGTPEPG